MTQRLTYFFKNVFFRRRNVHLVESLLCLKVIKLTLEFKLIEPLIPFELIKPFMVIPY